MVVLGIVLLLVAVGGLTARNLDSRRQKVLVAASLAPFLMAASVPATILLAAGAGWVGFALGVVVVAAAVATRVPLYKKRFQARPAESDLTVMQANILLGTADAAALVAEVRGGAVDVLTVVELTPESVAALHAAGLDDELPHRFVSPGPGGHGTGIWSRYPLTEERRHDGFIAELLSARVAVPGAASVLVFAVHTVPPWPREPRA
ncbi:MAG: endonuclease/exonuclease/phosphatase family protein, partial [Rhodococcus sp. (in: high G+C Gram-positive bacteria)]